LAARDGRAEEIAGCRRGPRLVAWRKRVARFPFGSWNHLPV